MRIKDHPETLKLRLWFLTKGKKDMIINDEDRSIMT